MSSGSQTDYCPTCGDIIEGRRGKRFCSKACYNEFYNEERRNARSGLVATLNAFERSYHALAKLFPRSKGEKYISLTVLIQAGLDLNAPCNKCKVNHFDHEITRLANYGYSVDVARRSVIIFKFQQS